MDLPQARLPTPRDATGSLALIAGVVAFTAADFAYTAGWLSPDRLTPQDAHFYLAFLFFLR
jgi:catalase